MQSSLVFTSDTFAYCHAPTVVNGPQGLILACCAGPAEAHPQTSIWTATFDGTWRDHHPTVASLPSTGRNIPVWNPVLFRAQEEIRLYYRAGASPEDWTCAYIATQRGNSWTASTPHEPTLTGPVRNKPIQLKSGTTITATSTENYGWEVHFEIFHPDSKRWDRVTVPAAGIKAIQPVIIKHENDTLQALCRTKNSFIAHTWSFDSGQSWSPLELTNLVNPNAAIDAIKVDHLGFLLVYNNCQFARYQLTIAVSTNGVEWVDKLTLENSLGEYSYPSMTCSQDGSLHVVYTHNRTNIKHVALTKQEVTALFISK